MGLQIVTMRSICSKQHPEYIPDGKNLIFDVIRNCDFDSRLRIRELTKRTPEDDTDQNDTILVKLFVYTARFIVCGTK